MPYRQCSLCRLALIAAVCIGCAPRTEKPQPATPASKAVRPESAETRAAADELLGLMRKRLLIMHDVARWKRDAGMSIADPRRERELIERMVRSGAEHGLDSEWTQRFMAAQFEAGKAVQQADFDRLENTGVEKFAEVPKVPDHINVLRPKIESLSEAMLACYARHSSLLNRPGARDVLRERARELLSGDGIEDAVRQMAIRPLLERSP